MATGRTETVNGISYIAIPETNMSSACEGCSADCDDEIELCCALNDSATGCYGVIWTKKEDNPKQSEPAESKSDTEQKYTVEEVVDAIAFLYNDSYNIFVHHIKNYLNKLADPEYNKYLELKAKFED